MRRTLLAAVALGALLLALFIVASDSSERFSANLPLLFAFGGAISFILAALIGWRLWLLRRRIRRGVFGAKLTLRLLLMFGAVATVPGLVVYGASVFFLNRSIETWFDLRVDNALASGVKLGRVALDDLSAEVDRKAQRMSLLLADEGAGSVITALSNLREQSAVQEATLFDERGRVIAHVGGEGSRLLPVLPDSTTLWQVRQQKTYSRVEVDPERGLIMRAIVPVFTASLISETRILQLVQSVPTTLAHDAQAVESAYREYQQIAVARTGLKRVYGVALSLILLLALLMTVVVAYLLSERLGAPLRSLARGTRAVAKGDFSQVQPVSSRDELGVLILSFNRMTRQLADAREEAERNYRQTEQAKAFLERILANLSSGVVVLDDGLIVRAANLAAAEILDVSASELAGRALAALGEAGGALADFGAALVARFEHETGEWQEQRDYAGAGGKQTLLIRGSRLPAGVERGYLLVFDDISALIHAERNAAWSEVARRLAHEIKNPLTPIQLSAERIAHKLVPRLDAADAEFLARSTATIVNQVAAMKRMVDAFASYARMPKARLDALDLNALVREVAALYDAKSLGLTLALDAGLPSISGDSTLLRQVMHNLLQNAQDALAGCTAPRIRVVTAARGEMARLTVEDNGAGFPDHLMARLFEPYATTKAKGTGLGLAIVKKIVEEHQGKIRIENIAEGGARVHISLPLHHAAMSGETRQ